MEHFRNIILFFILLVVTACVQVVEEKPAHHLQVAISSARDTQTVYPIGTRFALSPKYIEEASLKPEEIQKVYHLYSNEIIKHFQQNRYLLVNNAQESEFLVGFGLALSQDLSDETINNEFGVSPGLAVSADNEKGSFLIYVVDTKSGERVWRGTAQAILNPNFTDQQRQDRAVKVVDMLLVQYHNVK